MSVARPKLLGEGADGDGVAGRWSPAIDALFAEYDREDSPGLNLSVVVGGAVAHRRGYGAANIEDGAPFTPATRLHLGSTTKHFCATCLLILEDRGQLSLGDSVRRHLPELPAFTDAITLRHLATMTSGLPDGLNAGFFAGAQPEWFPRDAHLDFVRRLASPMFAPGEGATYSNSNYLLLSQVIERISGRTLEAFMQAELFAPLGMTRTELVRDPSVVLAGKATGYAGGPGDWRRQSPHMDLCGDGGIVSTIAEMERWLAHYASGGRLCRDYRARMEAEAVLSDGAPTGYGLGLGLTPWAGRRKVSHGGGMPGYLSEFAFYPDDGLGIIWLANCMSPRLFETTDKIAAIVLGAAPASDPAATPPPALAVLKGVYVNHSLGCTAEFEQTDDETILHVMGERLELAADADGLIRPTKASAYYPFRVLTSEDGARPLVEMKIGTAQFQTFTPFDEADAAGVELGAYVGAYRSPLLGETHYVRLTDAGLEVTIDSAIRALIWRGLKPRGGDLFSGVIPGEPSDTDVSLIFRRDAAGAITGFDYNLSRFRGAWFERQRG